MLLGGATVLGSSALPRDAAAGPTAAGSGHLAAGDLRAASQPAAASTNATTPSMQVSVAPSDICAQNYSACSAGTSSARVALQVAGPAGGAGANWTSIDLLFLLETTPYDGAFDQAAGDTGADSCAAVTGLLCEESSLLLTFATNAGRIATSLAAAHPGVEINFGLVDYFATLTSFDDGDGDQYHVDVGNFTPASAFGTAVNNSLLNASHPVLTRPAMTIGDSDLSDNFLATDSISAMYLALFGGGLNWSNESHHVLVQLGSSAPQDPNYPENYCISPSDYRAFSSTCLGSTCEPSVTYGTLTSPACVGWVLGPANNTNASIANYARTSPECANSTGALCTIDAIDVWDTPTDPNSKGWPTGLRGGGPGGANTTLDSDNILQAGCDIATATRGSWDGPTFYSCNGTSGTLNYTGRTSDDTSLWSAITNVSLGGAMIGILAGRAATPMLQLVTGPGVLLAPEPNFTASCDGPGASSTCPQAPNVTNEGDLSVLAWNWSATPSSNWLITGDLWTVGFSVVAAAGVEGAVPVYLCASTSCLASGAGPVDGLSSVLSGVLGWNALSPAWSGTLPLAQVRVDAAPSPSVHLAASSDLGEAPFAATFTSSLSGGVAPEDVLIAFGDGGSISGIGTISHTYGAGTFSATAYVVDALGQTDRASVGITVLSPLQGWFSENLSYGTAPLAVSFVASAAAGEGPYAYAWSFGDGATSALASPAHTYHAAGTWNVTLTVTDALGYNETSTNTVLVGPATPAPHTTVPPPTSQPPSASNTSSGSTPYILYAGVAFVGLAAFAAGAVIFSRRGARPPPARSAGRSTEPTSRR